MPDQLPLVQAPDRERTGWRDWTALVLALLFGLGIWHVDGVAADAHNASVANREIGYRNRAAVCDFTREFGGIEPRQCNDPDIAPYRDHRIQPGEGERANTTLLLCQILKTLKTTAHQCGPRHAHR